MTNPQYAGLVIVIAGYPDDINQMLQTNSGLKSRFDYYLDFDDWKPVDCANFFVGKAKSEQVSFDLEAEVLAVLQDGFGKLVHLDGWANARDVLKVWKSSMQQRASRVIKESALKMGKRVLTLSDVQAGLESLLKSRKGKPVSPAVMIETKLPQRPRRRQRSRQPPRLPEVFAEHQEEPVQKQTQEMKQAPREKTNRLKRPSKSGPSGCCTSATARDPGVTDKAWAELEQVKAEEVRLEK
jgi:hypothetical protein